MSDLKDIDVKTEAKDTSSQDSLFKYLADYHIKASKAPRISFVEDPNLTSSYGSFRAKTNLLPDATIKQIRIQNLLVASILRVRGNTMSMMGRLQQNRWDIGLTLEVKKEFEDHIDSDQMPKIELRMSEFKQVLLNCGLTNGLKYDDKMTLADFLDLQAQNGLSFGRFATEIIRTEDNKIHRFRPTDVGGIYRVDKRSKNTLSQTRAFGNNELSRINHQDIDKVPESSEYEYVQIINGQPKTAFTADELIVYNLFPSSDVEHNGYPVTPLDTIVKTLLTHMSIETYNQLYFQNGRASKGAWIVRSEDVTEAVIEDWKQQFQASINNVNNAFRTPILKVGKEDQLDWMQTSSPQKDGEFSFLYDQVNRNIMSAFSISPEELPGYAHLGRGTNSQALSESNNEAKLTSQKDGGIRPLILKFERFLNDILFPMLDPELAQLCYISLSGLDAETRTQESVRLQQNSGIYYTYNDIMSEVKNQPINSVLGANVPLNVAFRQVMDTYAEVADINEDLLEDWGAQFDPLLKYKRDPFYFQHLQMLAQNNPAATLAIYTTRKDVLSILLSELKEKLEELEE